MLSLYCPVRMGDRSEWPTWQRATATNPSHRSKQTQTYQAMAVLGIVSKRLDKSILSTMALAFGRSKILFLCSATATAPAIGIHAYQQQPQQQQQFLAKLAGHPRWLSLSNTTPTWHNRSIPRSQEHHSSRTSSQRGGARASGSMRDDAVSVGSVASTASSRSAASAGSVQLAVRCTSK